MKRVYCRHNWGDQQTTITRGMFWRIIHVEQYRVCKTCDRRWVSWLSEPKEDVIGYVEEEKA